EPLALTGRLLLRHEEPEHAVPPQGPREEPRDDAAVDAAGEPDHGPSPAQPLEDLFAYGRGDPLGLGGRVESQQVGGDRGGPGHGRPAAARSSRLSTLPVDVLGRLSRISITCGTMKSSRRARQWRWMSRSVSRAPSFSVTTALMRSPSTGSGTPMTAASLIPSRSCSTFSTSRGLTFSPRVLMMSSLRPTK